MSRESHLAVIWDLAEVREARKSTRAGSSVSGNGGAAGERRVRVKAASDIEPKAVRWLMDQYIPLGKLTVLAGRPGLGKSLWTASLAADVSVGGIQGALWRKPASVLLASAEDDEEDTIAPRLIAAGADLNRVGVLDLVPERDADGAPMDGGFIQLPGDVDRIAREVRRTRAKLIIIDPVTGYLDGNHSAYSNQDVRRALGPLAQMARDRGCAIVVVMHLNKSSSTDPLVRIADSGAFTALARSVLIFGSDPDDPEGDDGANRILTVAKGNLKAHGAHSLTLAIESHMISGGRGKRRIQTARIEVTGTSTANAEDVLGDSSVRSASDDARGFLQDLLSSGPMPVQAIRDAAKKAGISMTTLNRTKQRMGIRSIRPGGVGGWIWKLPREKRRS